MNHKTSDKFEDFFDSSKIKPILFNLQKNNSHKKILGIDFGTSKTGLASFSFKTRIISPIMIYKRPRLNPEKEIEFFSNLIKDNQVIIIIIGISIITDFKTNKKSLGNRKLFEQSLEFVKKIKEKNQEIEFIFFDESFSSVFANQTLYESGFSRKKTAEKEDSVAASKILEDALEAFGFY